MGYMICFGECIVCNQLFYFNPNRVPSIRIRDNKEPVCKDCIERVNPIRIKNGLESIKILPGAYDLADEFDS